MFTVEVSLDNTPRYMATCRQAIRATILPQLLGGGATVAVRVNPDDHTQIALDLATEPPIITVSAADGDANTGSAAQILEHGEAVPGGHHREPAAGTAQRRGRRPVRVLADDPR